MPAASDVPSITLGHTVTPSPTNQLGVKGIGEAGTIGAAPAVINAIVDALSGLGVRDVPDAGQPAQRLERDPRRGRADRHRRNRRRRPSRRHRENHHRRGRGSVMIPAKFDYVRAGSAEEAIQLIGQHGDEAKFLAGGHSLLPLMRLRLAQPSVLVDIGRLRDLSYIRDAGDHIAIGALTRHMDVERSDVLAEHLPLLAHADESRRRSAGAPPRHDRRLDRPRRSGVRPAGDHARPRRDVRRPGPERDSGDRRRRLLRELPHLDPRPG